MESPQTADANPLPDGEPKNADVHRVSRTWVSKFRYAGRGIQFAIRGEKSFIVHAVATIFVIAAAAAFQVSSTEWAILLTCIAGVVAAECFNSAIESLARAITRETDPAIGRALDIAAGAVLLLSVGAASAGLVIFVPHLLRLFAS